MNNSKTPLVSIIMGIYNCAETLPEAIDSIISQTFTDWKLIMCDDGSADNTYEVAEKYVKEDPSRFVLIRNETNQGLNITLNNCLAIADGKYVARMDGDDISLPERLEKEVNFLEANPEYAIVSTSMIQFDENGDWGATAKPIEEPTIVDFVYHNPFHCHAPCMIRREAYLAVGGYTVDKRLLRFEDINLWFKLYGAGYRGYNLSEPLYKMRDDKNAVLRREAKTRMRVPYVLYTGYKLVNMPKKYYIHLVYECFRCTILSLMPRWAYSYLHRLKLRNR